MEHQPENKQVVFLVEDDDDARESLKFFFESYHLIVKPYASGQDFLDDLGPNADGCAVVDIRMPIMTGMEVQKRLKELHVTFPIIMLTAHADIPVAVEAIKQGAFDFVMKSASQHEIINAVLGGLKHSRTHRQQVFDLNKTRQQVGTLSKRELQVVDLVVEGLTSREISDRLNIRVKTVDAHRANLMRKMNAINVADLINKIVTLRNTGWVPNN